MERGGGGGRGRGGGGVRERGKYRNPERGVKWRRRGRSRRGESFGQFKGNEGGR